MIKLDKVTKLYKYKGFKHYVFKDLDLVLPTKRNIGLLGPNGAGKSTLLRLISGGETPNSGSIITDENMSFPIGMGQALLAVLSARENVKFVCRIYGKKDKEMEYIVNYVKDFAEIGDYFDQPLKTYSSGMRSRISFGLSMAFDFERYLVDETLSVGDQTFKNKAASVFKEKRAKSSTILASHSMSILKQNCEMGLFVNQGKVILFEKIDDAIDAYMKEVVNQPLRK
ncbi:MAG TPA: ABC transporter ATP-binding protein [Lentisphaeria bacterium]|nr:MAG: ABC transporter ATP-binding protein [Lentisphaerae bacterium GWF2_38_69]HBM16686.1 ABC transporter ATP-binding protein [Lentisphaeria bacterium]